MTNSELIAAALERLDKIELTAEGGVHFDVEEDGNSPYYVEITQPLVALIRAAATWQHDVGQPKYCCICHGWPSNEQPVIHAPDCALIQLCKAII